VRPSTPQLSKKGAHHGQAGAVIADANPQPGVTIDPLPLDTPSGSPVTCDLLAEHRTTGLALAGNLAVLDTTLGAILLTAQPTCE
jgi:hypothetical protein